MMYLNYILLTFLNTLHKAFVIPMFWITKDLRHRARITITNYTIKHKIFIRRYSDSEITNVGKRYKITKIDQLGKEIRKEYIHDYNISKLRYYSCLLIWIWLDDECSNDTYSIESIKLVKKKYPKIFNRYKDVYIKAISNYGHYDDKTELSKREIRLLEWTELLCASRCNFDNYFLVKSNKGVVHDKVFLFSIFGRLFGWRLVNGSKLSYYEYVFNDKK